jgi:hypothetical protein
MRLTSREAAFSPGVIRPRSRRLLVSLSVPVNETAGAHRRPPEEESDRLDTAARGATPPEGLERALRIILERYRALIALRPRTTRLRVARTGEFVFVWAFEPHFTSPGKRPAVCIPYSRLWAPVLRQFVADWTLDCLAKSSGLGTKPAHGTDRRFGSASDHLVGGVLGPSFLV